VIHTRAGGTGPVFYVPDDPQGTIEWLRPRGVNLGLTADGRLVGHPAPIPSWARFAVAWHRDAIVAILVGRRTGHVWARCDQCSEGRMVRAGASPGCALTPRCEGRHRHVEDARTARLEEPK
jgi:hypothetical protein